MANPNIVNVTTINGLTVANTPSTATATTLLSNPASSSQVFKINTLIATNMSGVANTSIGCTVSYNNGANNTGTSYPVANNISVPQAASLIVLDKSSSIYLTENTSIVVTSSSANGLSFVCSYEVIS